MASHLWLLFLFGLLSLMAKGAFPKPRPSVMREGRSCRCVPDQFEVTLISLEREFDLMGKQLREKQASMLVHYDYTRKRFASTEVESGVRTVADYGKVSILSLRISFDARSNIVISGLAISWSRLRHDLSCKRM